MKECFEILYQIVQIQMIMKIDNNELTYAINDSIKLFDFMIDRIK